MRIIDNSNLLTAHQTQILNQNVKKPFSFGGYNSLDDILTKLGVDVIIEKGVLYHSVPKSLNDAEAFWKGLAEPEACHYNCPFGLRDFASHKNNNRSDKCEACKVIREGIREDIRKEKEALLNTLILGLYDPARNCIILYPEAMMLVYGGKWMDELLVSTLAHEIMHAYFNRPGHDKYPYIYFLEEPLAEFGMLFYLHQTGSSYYAWAFNNVREKQTCYHYGADLMTLTLKASNPSGSSYYKYLLAYKKSLPIGSMIYTIGIISKRAIIKTAFDNLYADLGGDLTDYLRTNLANGTMTRTPATIQLTNGSFINVGKWAPTGSSRAIILEVNKADYPLMDTAAKHKDRDRFFPDIYEANQLYTDSVFLLSNQWGGGDNSFNKIIDGFCKSVNTMAAKTGRPDYFSTGVIAILKMPVKSLTP